MSQGQKHDACFAVWWLQIGPISWISFIAFIFAPVLGFFMNWNLFPWSAFLPAQRKISTFKCQARYLPQKSFELDQGCNWVLGNLFHFINVFLCSSLPILNYYVNFNLFGNHITKVFWNRTLGFNSFKINSKCQGTIQVFRHCSVHT